MRTIITDIFKKHPLTCFLIIHFLVWSALPMYRTGAPMDSMEAVWWGKYCLWGTNKHPPLSGFPAYLYYLLFLENTKSIYVLSQSCILVGFIYIYKLALCLLDKEKAVLATMLLEGVIFYNYCSPEYNVNVLSLAIWPANAYYFYRALTEGKTSCWLMVGICSALNILNKYVGGIQLLGMGLYLVFFENGRKYLKSYKPYLTVLVFLLLIAPHFYWLYKHDFFVLNYFASRSGGNKTIESYAILKHFIYPLKFFASMVLYCAASVLIFLTTGHPEKFKGTIKHNGFLFCLGIFPFLFIIVFSALTGNHIKSMWGYPVLYMLGIVLFSFFNVSLNNQLFQKFVKRIYLIMGVLASIYLCVLLFTTSPKYNIDGKQFAAEYTKVWKERTAHPLKYVIGGVWLTSTMVLESQDKPTPVIGGATNNNPWVDVADFQKNGALVLAENNDEYDNYESIYSNKITPRTEVVLEFKNIMGKIKRKQIYYGFYKGELND